MIYKLELYKKTRILFNELDIELLGIFSILSLLHFIIGYYFFTKLKGVFNDYI